MESGVLSGMTILLLILVFIGIVAWAWSAKRKKAFDEAARLPLDDELEEKAGRHE